MVEEPSMMERLFVLTFPNIHVSARHALKRDNEGAMVTISLPRESLKDRKRPSPGKEPIQYSKVVRRGKLVSVHERVALVVPNEGKEAKVHYTRRR